MHKKSSHGASPPLTTPTPNSSSPGSRIPSHPLRSLLVCEMENDLQPLNLCMRYVEFTGNCPGSKTTGHTAPDRVNPGISCQPVPAAHRW